MNTLEDILAVKAELEQLDRRYPPLHYVCNDGLDPGSMVTFDNPLDGKKYVLFHPADYSTLHYEIVQRAVAEGDSTIIGLRWYYEEEARKLSDAYGKYAERKYMGVEDAGN